MRIDFRCSYENFSAEFFEKKPLFLSECFLPPKDPLHVIDDALSSVDATESFFKVQKNTERVEHSSLVEEYVDIGVRRRRIRKDALYRQLEDGASLVLNRIDTYSPPVSDLCLQISRFARAQASANAYVSFGRDPATDVHWDRHDIFAIQMYGEKRWELFAPTFQLPLNSQTSSNKKSEAPSECYLDVVLRAGDILYLPRGWWHRVTPVGTKPTFHLAVGAHTPLMLDYLIWACGNKFPDHFSFRKSVNGIKLGDGQLDNIGREISKIIADESNFLDFIERAQSRERVVSQTSLAKLFLAVDDPYDKIKEVQVNSRYVSGEKLFINGKELFLDKMEKTILEFINTNIGASESDILKMLHSINCADPRKLFRGMLQRDIISYINKY